MPNILCQDGRTATVGDHVDVELAVGGFVNGEILSIDEQFIYIRPSNTKATIKLQESQIYDIFYSTKVMDSAIRDNINHPSHYQSETGLEVIEVIEAFTFDLKGIEATDTGNIIKYICRWKNKNGLEDLRKAKWYVEHLIKHVEKIEKENN